MITLAKQATLQHKLLIDDETSQVQSILSKQFKWLHSCLLYCPMHTTNLPSNKKRSKSISAIIVIITIIALIFHTIEVMQTIIIDYSGDIVFQIAYIFSESIGTLGRLLSIYYFYTYFDYPWSSTLLNEAHFNVKKLKRCVFIIKCFMTLIFTIDIVLVTGYILEIISFNGGLLQFILQVLMLCIGRFFLYWPIFLSFATTSAILIKYYCHLLQITKELNTGYQNVFSRYQTLLYWFNIEFPASLKWCIELYLLTTLIDAWIDSYRIFHKRGADWCDIVNLAEEFVIDTMFVISTSWVNEAYYKFEKLLWDQGKKYMMDTYSDKHSTIHDEYRYNYLLHYVLKYPFKITIGNLAVTKNNAIKFVIGFLIAKAISYSFEVIL